MGGGTSRFSSLPARILNYMSADQPPATRTYKSRAPDLTPHADTVAKDPSSPPSAQIAMVGAASKKVSARGALLRNGENLILLFCFPGITVRVVLILVYAFSTVGISTATDALYILLSSCSCCGGITLHVCETPFFRFPCGGR